MGRKTISETSSWGTDRTRFWSRSRRTWRPWQLSLSRDQIRDNRKGVKRTFLSMLLCQTNKRVGRGKILILLSVTQCPKLRSTIQPKSWVQPPISTSLETFKRHIKKALPLCYSQLQTKIRLAAPLKLCGTRNFSSNPSQCLLSTSR